MPKLILTVGLDKTIKKELEASRLLPSPAMLKRIEEALLALSVGPGMMGFTVEYEVRTIQDLEVLEEHLKMCLADRHDVVSAVVQQKHDKAELPRKLDMPRPMERVWAKEDRSE